VVNRPEREAKYSLPSNAEVKNLRSYIIHQNQIKENEVGRVCGTHWRGEKRVQGFGAKAKRPIERPRHRWEDGIKMDLREMSWGVCSGFTWLRIGTVGGLL
jgi:hypothetical protein